MQIKAQNTTVKEIVNQYQNNYEEGITGYSGKLNIRPAYQREFVYKDKQRDAVINTVMNGLPLSIFPSGFYSVGIRAVVGIPIM